MILSVPRRPTVAKASKNSVADADIFAKNNVALKAC